MACGEGNCHCGKNEWKISAQLRLVNLAEN